MITAAEVQAWMGLEMLSEQESESLGYVVDAVNAYVSALPSIDRDDTTVDGWAANTRLGALLLASRLYRRKNSAGGIESVGEVATFVSRWDSDIARLLNMGDYSKPVIG